MRRWRPTTWVWLIFNVLMAAWFLLGTGGFCDEYVGLELEACERGEYGYDLGAWLVLSLWLWGNALLAIIWVIGRRRHLQDHDD